MITTSAMTTPTKVPVDTEDLECCVAVCVGDVLVEELCSEAVGVEAGKMTVAYVLEARP